MINYFHFIPKNIYTAIVVVFLFFGMEGFGQTISKPIVSGTPVCAGSSVEVSFVVTNGEGKDTGGSQKYFTTATNYTLELYLDKTLKKSFDFSSQTAPAPSGGATDTIVQVFTIPPNMVFNNLYSIKVLSTNPSPTGNADNNGVPPGQVGNVPTTTSDSFEIHAVINNNMITADQWGCNPYISQTLMGSSPAGGNNILTYLWESSTTSFNAGFSAAPGVNNSKDYSPGTLSQTTWYRRVVSSGACTNTSNVIEINITHKWTGNIDTDWNKPGNWSCNAVPTPNTDVIIPSEPASNNYPVLNIGAVGTVNNINIETGASITITNNVLEIGGIISNNGIFDTQNGSLNFVGAAPQTLPAGSLLNNRIANLTVNNSAGLNLEGPVEVSGTVLAQTGNLFSNGHLKLISDATQTALIDGAGAGEVLGNVIMQRDLSNGFGYKYFSTPFSNSTVADFSPFMDLEDPITTFPHLYEYHENREDVNGNDLSGWQALIQSTASLEIGKGYALNISNSTTPVTIEISGEVNNGPVNILLTNNNGIYTQGFNLVGNPYPSPIDWNDMVPTLNGIDNAIYFFTAGTDNRYTGTYTSFVNGVSTDSRSSNIIPSMQGFFVRASDPIDGTYPASATLGFTNAFRTDNNIPQDFYKSKITNLKPQIRLTAGFTGKKKLDAAVIYFNGKATVEFEKKLDAYKILNTAPEVPSLYSLTKSLQKLSINAVAAEKLQEIPIGVTIEKSGELFIKLASIENIFPTTNIYLKDLQEKVILDLSEDSTYFFTSQKGEVNDRFILLLSSEKLSATEKDMTFQPFSVYSGNKGILVKLNLIENVYKRFFLSNITGRFLEEKFGKGKEEILFCGNYAPGVYLVTMESKGECITKKILIKK